MNYELAKELKDAGFPQDGHFGIDAVGTVGCIGDHPAKLPLIVKAPTLSELIEACGERSFILNAARTRGHRNSWYAEAGGVEAIGPTPEEAVARLWLALNKKP